MKQKEVFKKIGGIIEELSDQYEYLKTVTDDLNDLELELFASNAHFLTDHVEILCKLNLQNHLAKKASEKREVEKRDVERKATPPREEKYFEPMVQQMKPEAEKKEDEPTIEPPIPAEKEVVAEIEPDDQPVPEIDLTGGAQADEYSFIREEPETIRHELILDDAINWEDDDEKPTIEPEPEEVKSFKKKKNAPAEEIAAPEITFEIPEIITEIPEVEVDAPQPIIEEKPEEVLEPTLPTAADEDEVLTINQKMLSQLGDKSIARTEQLSIKPISDIKLAITLNDKLLYVKDLFNGYNLAYSEAIEILNRFNTFEEAQRFLKTNYVTKNNWEGKPATTEKFYALLKRRYA